MSNASELIAKFSVDVGKTQTEVLQGLTIAAHKGVDGEWWSLTTTINENGQSTMYKRNQGHGFTGQQINIENLRDGNITLGWSDVNERGIATHTGIGVVPLDDELFVVSQNLNCGAISVNEAATDSAQAEALEKAVAIGRTVLGHLKEIAVRDVAPWAQSHQLTRA